MKYYPVVCFLFICSVTFGQVPTTITFGFEYIPFLFEGDTVDIIIDTKRGEKKKKKPLFFFVQGSLPRPLFLHNGERFSNNILPFDPVPYLEQYHFVMVGKPGIPLMPKLEELHDFNFFDKNTKTFPEAYCKNNHLDYYVNRNKAILDFLAQQDWVDEKRIIVAGHSEGFMVAYKMAVEKAKMTDLVLLNGNLMGRILSIMIDVRGNQHQNRDSTTSEEIFSYWKELNQSTSFSNDCSSGDSDKATASFSYPYLKHLEEVNIPTFIGYGTQDGAALLNDYLRMETIRLKKDNYHYQTYFGLEHSFFRVKENGEVNYEDPRFDVVMKDVFNWLKR